MLGTYRDRIRELAASGKIKASKKESGQWIIPESEIPKLKIYLEASITKKKVSELAFVTPCPIAKEIEPDLYQCPSTDWMKVRKGAQVCASCKMINNHKN